MQDKNNNETSTNQKKFWQSGVQVALSGLMAGLLVIGYLQLQTPGTPAVNPTGDQGQLPFASSAAQAAPTVPLGVAEKQVIDLYKNNSESVVNVTTRSVEYNYYQQPVPREGAGSGFVIDKEGHVVTNYHVVEGAQRFFVAFGNMEESYPAELVGFDKSNDIAVLKVKAPNEMLKPVQLGDSENLEVGQTAVAIGNPFGLGQTITTGVVSSIGRTIQAEKGRIISGLIQTDAAINQGNSGGPLFDANGRVIGVNTMIFSPSGGSVGIGFAIPISTVKRFVPDLIKHGRVQHPLLGVSILPLSPRLSQALKLNANEGLLVVKAWPNTPAGNAGIQGGNRRVYLGNYEVLLGGDILLAVDGKKLNSEAELTNYLQTSKNIGDTMEVSLLRNGSTEPQTVTVTLTASRNN